MFVISIVLIVVVLLFVAGSKGVCDTIVLCPSNIMAVAQAVECTDGCFEELSEEDKLMYDVPIARDRASALLGDMDACALHMGKDAVQQYVLYVQLRCGMYCTLDMHYMHAVFKEEAARIGVAPYVGIPMTPLDEFVF